MRSRPRGLGFGVDSTARIPERFDHDPTFAGPYARAAVAPAADSELQAALARKRDDPGDVLRARGTDDRRRPAIDPLKTTWRASP